MTDNSLFSSEVQPLKYRPDIDGLRGIAVLSVVGFHIFGIRGGFVGVDIFFVISGFLISTILLTNLNNNTFQLHQFYIKRIKRIFPALILVLFTSMLIGWFVLLPEEYKQLGRHTAGAAVFTSNYLLWEESGYFDNAAKTKPLLHLWSLGIEEQFYIIWPLLLWLVWKNKLNLFWIILFLSLASFSLNVRGINVDSVATFYSPQTRFWELLSGSLLAWMIILPGNKISTDNPKLRHHLLSFFGILLIAYSQLILTPESNFPGFLALLPTIGTVLILFAGAQAWLNRVILSHRMLVWVGLISYPLYLWHWPLLVFSKLSLAGALWSSRNTKWLVVAASILLATLTYKLFENPIRFGKNSKTKTIALVLFLLIIGLLGYGIYVNNGITQRVPTILQDISRSSKYLAKFDVGTCFLENSEGQFGRCMLDLDKHKKTILLWGDSHAAHFYAGYKHQFGADFNIILRSASGCRPLLEDGCSDKKCNAIKKNILLLIQKVKPDKVILSAAWGHHDDWMKVTKTITILKNMGITNIDLIGPAPHWVDTLPRQLFIYSQQDTQHRIPMRMSFGLNPRFFKIDQMMKTLAEREKINYISLADVLCNQHGCITRIGKNYDELISLDYGHFTEFASIYIVSKI